MVNGVHRASVNGNDNDEWEPYVLLCRHEFQDHRCLLGPIAIEGLRLHGKFPLHNDV